MKSVIDFYIETLGKDRKEPFTLVEMLSFAEGYANMRESMELIVAIAIEFEVSVPAIFSKSRKKELVESRQMYSLLLSEHLRVKPQIIADHLGLDRVTTRHGIIKMGEHIATELSARSIYNRLQAMIVSGKVKMPERLAKFNNIEQGEN